MIKESYYNIVLKQFCCIYFKFEDFFFTIYYDIDYSNILIFKYITLSQWDRYIFSKVKTKMNQGLICILMEYSYSILNKFMKKKSSQLTLYEMRICVII